MKENRIFTNLFKCVTLLILDVVTFLVVFSVWSIVNIWVFPWAFASILFSLILVNTMVLASGYLIRSYSLGIYASALISTFFYYIFVIGFTWFTYIQILPKWYIISVLLITLMYFTVISGLHLSGIRKRQDIVNQDVEQERKLDMKLRFISLKEAIEKCENFVEKDSYNEMIKTFLDLQERFESSTPFGRNVKPVVVKFEQDIILKFNEVQDNVALLKSEEEILKCCKIIIVALSDLKVMIINREKMLFQ